MADDPTTPAVPDPADRIRELEAQVAKERQRAELVERTLSALGDRQPAAQPPPAHAAGPAPAPIHFSRDQITRIAQATGLPEETVQQYAPLIGAMFTEFATPYIRDVGGAMNTIGDYLDRHEVELSPKEVSDYYRSHKDEIEQERKSGPSGRSRTELVQIVRARHLPEIIAEEASRKVAEDAARAASASAATTEPTTKQVARPSPTQAATPKSVEEISKIPDRNERIAALEAAAEGQTF